MRNTRLRMYRGGELETAGPCATEAIAGSESCPDAASAITFAVVPGFCFTRMEIGPTSFGSPQLQQSRVHLLVAASRAIGQSACIAGMSIGHAAGAASARNGHVRTSAAGTPARSATTTTAANWAIRFIRLL